MTFVSDLAQQLLSCLDVSLQDGPNPPPDENICLRTGEVAFDAGYAQDQCCEGMAWVRVVRIYPSTRFPQQDTTPNDCVHSSRAIQLEMGVIRCMPFGDENAGPSCAQHTEVFLQVDEDAASMRRALCCMADLIPAGYQFVEDEWVPVGPQGGCVGGTTNVIFQSDCNECIEVTP